MYFMKNFLLSFVAIMIVTAASAQKVGVKPLAVNGKSFNIEQRFNIGDMFNKNDLNIRTTNAKAKIIKKAEDDSEVFGFFVQVFESEDLEGFNISATDTIYNANKTLTVPVDSLGNTEDVQCNICLKRNFGGYKMTEEYYGVYNKTDEGEIIYFPEQISLKLDGVNKTSGEEYHYDIYMYNIDLTEDGQYIENVYPLTFESEGDGTYYSPNDGWGIYYIDRTTGKGLGWGGFVWDPTLYKANGTSACYTSRSGVRTDYNSNAYIEDWGNQVVVYGWIGTSMTIQVVNSDSVQVVAGFPVSDVNIKQADGYLWDAGRILGYAWEVDDEGYIHDSNDPYIPGYLKGNTITIPGIYTRSEVGGTGDYAGYYYGINFYRDITFVLNDGSYSSSGINEVNASSKSSKMTYNLMGQKVNGAVKGLVIRDGKKFVVK